MDVGREVHHVSSLARVPKCAGHTQIELFIFGCARSDLRAFMYVCVPTLLQTEWVSAHPLHSTLTLSMGPISSGAGPDGDSGVRSSGEKSGIDIRPA